jgi:hypothetical protein
VAAKLRQPSVIQCAAISLKKKKSVFFFLIIFLKYYFLYKKYVLAKFLRVNICVIMPQNLFMNLILRLRDRRLTI